MVRGSRGAPVLDLAAAGFVKSSRGSAREAASDRRLAMLGLASALIVLPLLVYWPVRHFQFVNWDDFTLVAGNAHVSAGLSWQGVGWAFTTNVAGVWFPLTMLSHMLDVQWFGMDAGAHHVTSLVLHIANTLLLFGLLRAMTRAAGRSFFVAAIFAVHPLHVESVAWISDRKDVLSTLLVLLTVWAYVRYVRRPAAGRYAVVVLLFALALLAKSVAGTLPLLLLLLDVWPLGRLRVESSNLTVVRRVLLEKVPLLGLAVGALGIAMRMEGQASALYPLPWPTRFAHAIVNYVIYLADTLWPAHLAAFYPLRPVSAALAIGAALGLVAVTLAAVRVSARSPYVAVGWLWYVISLVPVAGFVQVGAHARADRYMYVPLIGLLVIAAWGAADLLAPIRQRRLVLSCRSADRHLRHHGARPGRVVGGRRRPLAACDCRRP
jgi:hypothetical protein